MVASFAVCVCACLPNSFGEAAVGRQCFARCCVQLHAQATKMRKLKLNWNKTLEYERIRESMRPVKAPLSLPIIQRGCGWFHLRVILEIISQHGGQWAYCFDLVAVIQLSTLCNKQQRSLESCSWIIDCPVLGRPFISMSENNSKLQLNYRAASTVLSGKWRANISLFLIWSFYFLFLVQEQLDLSKGHSMVHPFECLVV